MAISLLASGITPIAFKTYFSITSLIFTNLLFLLLISSSSYKNIFPYPRFYPNQKEIIEYISASIKEGKNPVFESPTGSGKTVAVLTALIPFAKEKGKKILYLCRTHEQMDRVIEELKEISTNDKVKGLSLRSRRDMCLNEFIIEKNLSASDERLACSILKKEGKCNHYKNLKKRTLDFNGPVTAAEVIRASKGRGICPYEASRINLSGCDVIALSYLYVFEPEIRAVFLKSIGLSMGDFILVLDEAHNLPKLAVDIAGERLTEFAVSRAIKEAEDHKVQNAERFLEKLHKFIILNESEEIRLDKEPLLNYLGEDLQTVHYLEDIGDEIRKGKIAEGKRPVSFLHSVATFVRRWMESYPEEFAYFSSKTQKRMSFLEILSLEPKTITKSPLNEAYLSVHMSGTLIPLEPYSEVIGLGNVVAKNFPSPFPKENVAVYVDPSVSTMGSLRTREMYGKIANKVQTYLSAIPGNALVFFPSYVVLKSVLNTGIQINKDVFVESPGMKSLENNEMIKQFKKSRNAVLFGVQQGRNSEGQDFPGKQAEGVIIVGIPYPVKGPRMKAQIEYFKRRYRGWWGKYSLGEYYAYFLPAYRSLNQSAGRAHRQLSDKAAIIFLESRVAFDRKVRANISPWIKENLIVEENFEKEIKSFYISS
jgi:DNA excision repair protein ERCC-2